MTKYRSRLNGYFANLLTGLCLAPAYWLAAEQGCSLTEREIEQSQREVAIDSLKSENATLKLKVEQGEAVLETTLKNLSVAISEAEEFKRKASELKQRLEALGVDGAGGNLERLQQRLLRAVSDLKYAHDDRDKLYGGLLELTETINASRQLSADSESLKAEAIEVALRNAFKALGVERAMSTEVSLTNTTLQDGVVISIKEDLALVVANVGVRQGVRAGMPFKVLRDDIFVGTVRVVDARERIAGAVIQDLSSEVNSIHVGDHLKVIATAK